MALAPAAKEHFLSLNVRRIDHVFIPEHHQHKQALGQRIGVVHAACNQRTHRCDPSRLAD